MSVVLKQDGKCYEVLDTREIVDGTFIFNLRKKLGLSQRKFAMILGTDESTYIRWEHDKRHIGTANSRLLYLIDKNPELWRDLVKIKEGSND